MLPPASRILHATSLVVFAMTYLQLAHPSADDRCPRNASNVFGDEWSSGQCGQHEQQLAAGRFYELFLQHPSPDRFDVLCSMFQRWMVCVRSAASKCNVSSNSINAQFDQTKSIIERTCIDRRNVTLVNLPCLATQSRELNPLFNGCFITMQLRRKAVVLPLCRLMSEFLQCQDRLVRSACGSSLADFTLAVSIENHVRLATDAELQQQRCRADTIMDDYSSSNVGLQYSLTCPPEFPTVVRHCYREFMRTRVVLYPTLPAVIRSSVDNIRRWCSALQEYKQCVAPVVAMCPDGVHAIYAVSTEWDKNIQLATYTCNTALDEYVQSLSCYVAVVQRLASYLRLCRELYDHHPSRHQAYQFTCSSSSNASRFAVAERGRLIDCYAAFFAKRCGDASRRTLRPLLRMHYAFDFLPPCVGESPLPQSPTTPPPTTPEVSADPAAVTWSPSTTVTSRTASNAPSPAAVMSGRSRAVSRDLMTLLCALASASLRRALSVTSS